MYSQHNEDSYLIDLIRNRKLKVTPTFADFGACDGVHLSNTRAFAELGWSGVMVEPSPAYFEQLQNNYAHRKDIRTINAAVSDIDGEATFYYDPDRPDHSSLIKGKGNIKPFTVKLVAAQDIIPVPCGLLSIDVEGMEAVILNELFYKAIYPEIIITESNDVSSRYDQIELLNGEYHLINVLDVNTIWVRRDKWM